MRKSAQRVDEGSDVVVCSRLRLWAGVEEAAVAFSGTTSKDMNFYRVGAAATRSSWVNGYCDSLCGEDLARATGDVGARGRLLKLYGAALDQHECSE